MLKGSAKKYLRLLTYLSGFFLTVHMAFPSYFASQFLGQYLSNRQVGFVYIVASLITILFIIYTPRIIRRIGLVKTVVLLTIADLVAILPLPFIKDPSWAISFFTAYYALGLVVRYALDIYLEKISDDRTEGGIRGIFLTFVNIAWLVSPFLAGQLISDRGYSIIFLIAGLQLLPLLAIAIFGLKESDTHRNVPTPKIRAGLYKLWKGATARDRNIFNILATDFLLNFFYAVMVIYMALYLTETIGLSKVGIGVAFTIMLLPFVLFELPLGQIADHWLGEKEILIAGFIIMSLATIAVPFITTKTIWVWALILFLTRTGAAAVEIMKETYLFKKITGDDTDILAISRNMQPVTYIIGPLLVSLFLSFFDFKYVFLALGIIVLSGVYFSLRIRDTK
ncbi:MAG: MFS transporter [Candidatus Vogelbacteria bacterium]|nr:MFS transporter [Candidatus Vogelbacteria bacterium]